MEDKEFEMKRSMPPCPVLKVDGVIEKGKQFDLDITLPEDQRDVIYGTIKNVFKEPVKNAVVKLIEIEFGKDGIKKRCPISHAFSDAEQLALLRRKLLITQDTTIPQFTQLAELLDGINGRRVLHTRAVCPVPLLF